MSESSPRPRSFVTRSLDQQNIDWLNQLDKSLIENPFDYYSHLSLVTTLHQGLQNHLASFDSDPNSYELVQTLRDAYKAMSDKYPLGELLWHYRLNDEKTLARNVEERMGVLELHKQATQDEPYSAKLWAAYGEYVSYLVACSWEQVPPEQWPEEERLIGRELFNPQFLLDALQQGAEKVKYNLQESNLVWDRYLQVLEEDLERGGFSREKAARVATIYNERLSQPHATWANTLSRYSSFNSRYNQSHYEEVMEQAVQKNTHIKQQYAHREEYEFKLLQAIQSGDQGAEYHAMTRYLKWEKKTAGVYSVHLVSALYERATLRFPVDPSIWEDYVEFLIWQKDRSVDLLNVLERATRHCPWSGSLWSHRILTLEAENKAFEVIERVKHTATGSGLLEHTDVDELIKVQIAWCGYLRRRAFDDPRATEEEVDVAEVGIRSALEFVKEVGMKKHGREWADPQYRLERLHMKFWLQKNSVDEARQIWNSLVKSQADFYDFWYRWYIFEMVFWSQHATRNEQNAGQQLLPPSPATAVLERGMERLQTIDHPEPLVEMYMNHCEQHESVLKVRSAAIDRRRADRTISIRREKERTAAAATLAQQETSESPAEDGSGKRKREDNAEGGTVLKKSKLSSANEQHNDATTEQARVASEAPSEAPSNKPKRDREHTSVIVKKLPLATASSRIRQFFTDAGTVKDLVLKEEKDSLTAIVEFETSEEADYALTKEAKGFEGHTISIERTMSTTLYVANYPLHADEAWLRELYSPFGEIISIRFPSLKYNTNRHFCYVQFAKAEDAVAATQLDGTDIEGLKITSKISNPTAKKQRDSATAEGREVYIWHLNFKIKRREIEDAFSNFGNIVRLTCPVMKGTGNNKGFCYVVYESKESADAAVAEMDGKNFWGFELNVQIASDQHKPKTLAKLENASSSKTIEVNAEQTASQSDASIKPVPFSERSIAILNLPDTVPVPRLKPLVEPYGFKMIKLEPHHGGAIIEFTTIEDAGKAAFALEGQEFEGRKLRIGTIRELNQQKGEWRAGSSFVQPKHVNRPVARGGGRGRGKAGLGRPAIPRTAVTTNGEAKSNSDFRAMLLKEPAKGGAQQGKEPVEGTKQDKGKMEE
ncbi:Splicing factor [Neocucurbitaria cava]|uniref:U4/U6 snRNA-associated-splicing factor PRP24 n=1 Tax=Neocucurbitaria cava TaxID=798079 RepID=A0A9W9CGA5_9PLEO|nr:Splicing factor [Neocucurbitaria cava]